MSPSCPPAMSPSWASGRSGAEISVIGYVLKEAFLRAVTTARTVLLGLPWTYRTVWKDLMDLGEWLHIHFSLPRQ